MVTTKEKVKRNSMKIVPDAKEKLKLTSDQKELVILLDKAVKKYLKQNRQADLFIPGRLTQIFADVLRIAFKMQNRIRT